MKSTFQEVEYMNELYVSDCSIYFRTNANTLDDAIEEISSRCIEEGIEINVDCAVLRDSDGNDIDD